MLYQPEAHERLTDEEWNEERVRDAVRSITAETEDAFDDGWDTRTRTLYSGGAGIVDALRRLAEGGLAELRRDYFSYLERSLEEAPDFPDGDTREPLLQRVGIRLVLQRLAPSAENLGELAARIEENARDERRELDVGVGTMLVARVRRPLGRERRVAHRRTRRRRDLGAEPLRNACPLPRSLRTDSRAARSARTACQRGRATPHDSRTGRRPRAMRSSRPGTARSARSGVTARRGMVTSLGDLLTRTPHWRPASSGPLVKGANLCHGTAGNGYAFLTLFARTGDER